MKVYAFDFDGTLTTRDTLLEFIRFACGRWAFLWGFLLYSPLLVLMKLRLYPNWKAKQHIFAYFFKGTKKSEFIELGQRFAAQHKSLIRPAGFAKLREALHEGARVVVVSASVKDWVTPFFHEFAENVQFACTEVEEQEGILTGRFLTANCYGEEKVRRVKELFPKREEYTLVAYGDSRGDKELLAEADEAHYKPFEREEIKDKR